MVRTPKLKSRRAGRPRGIATAPHATSRAGYSEQDELVGIGLRKGSGRNDVLPALAVTRVPIDSLRPALRRVRRAEAAQINRIRTSIRTFGTCAPILVDHDQRIVHGHNVWEAARQEGASEIPVIEIGHLSASKLRQLSIALNRLGETGAWDESALRLEVQELTLLEDEHLVTGFEAAEIDALLLEDDGPPEQPQEVMPTMPTRPVSWVGDIWRLGEHLLLQGDGREPDGYTRLFEDGQRASLVLTDADPEFNLPSREISRDEALT